MKNETKPKIEGSFNLEEQVQDVVIVYSTEEKDNAWLLEQMESIVKPSLN